MSSVHQSPSLQSVSCAHRSFFGPLNMHTKNRLLHTKVDFTSRSERPMHTKQSYRGKKWNGWKGQKTFGRC